MTNYATKWKLIILKVKSYKIDISKRKTIPADLNKLSKAVDNSVVKNAVCDKLVLKNKHYYQR